MARNNTGLDLAFGIIGLIAEVALESGSNTKNTPYYGKLARSNRKPYKKTTTDDILSGYHAADPFLSPLNTEKPDRYTSPDTVADIEPVRNINPTKNAKQIKLETLLLNYMFLEDDGRINLKEKLAIKKHYRKYSNKLSHDDIEYIKDIKNMDSSLMNIRSYISQNDVSDIELNSALNTVKSICEERRYKDIISRVESSLNNSIGY